MTLLGNYFNCYLKTHYYWKILLKWISGIRKQLKKRTLQLTKMAYSYIRNYRTCTDAYIPKCIYTRWNQLEHSTCFSQWPRLVKQVMKNKFTIKARHCKIHNEYENNGSRAYNNAKKKKKRSRWQARNAYIFLLCSIIAALKWIQFLWEISQNFFFI